MFILAHIYKTSSLYDKYENLKDGNILLITIFHNIQRVYKYKKDIFCFHIAIILKIFNLLSKNVKILINEYKNGFVSILLCLVF